MPYMSTACSGTRGGKNISESFVVEKETRFWHEQQYRAWRIRWATGNYDAQEELSLSSAYGLRSRGEITSLRVLMVCIAYGNYGFFIRMMAAAQNADGLWR